MEWLFSLALLPLLLCGAMCVGGMLLAFLGIRRATDSSSHESRPGDEFDRSAETPFAHH